MSDVLRQAVDEAVFEALSAAVGSRLARETLATGKGRARCTQPHHDFETLAPMVALHRARGSLASRRGLASDEHAEACRGVVAQFPDERALALAVVAHCRCDGVIAHVRVASVAGDARAGALALTTRERELAHVAAGRVRCEGCGGDFGAGRALRAHRSGDNDAAVRCAELLGRPRWHERAEADATAVPQQPPLPRPLPPALEAARDGDLGALCALAAAGWEPSAARPDARDRHGACALLWAAGSGHLAVVRWLVETQHCDPATRRRRDGRGALHFAARNGRLEVARWLVDVAGCDIDGESGTTNGATDGLAANGARGSDTPLMLAVWQGHLDLAVWLHARGADASRENAYGCTVAHKAVRMDGAASNTRGAAGRRALLEWLRDGARVGFDTINDNGHAPLHKAALHGRDDVCRWLLRESSGDSSRGPCTDGIAAGGAAVCCAPDADGQTPSELARCNGHLALARELRHHEDVLARVPIVYVPKPDIGSPPLELGPETACATSGWGRGGVVRCHAGSCAMPGDLAERFVHAL